MANFRHVIANAYLRILLRQPDPGGLEHYNQLMNQGLTEAQLREILLRSPEYASRFPEHAAGARRAAARGGARGKRAGRGRGGKARARR
jgi:hypothetical protein